MRKHVLPPPIARLLVAIMMCLPVWGSYALAQSPESYAVFDATTGTLTFKHDTAKPAGAYEWNEYFAPGWSAQKSNVKTVVFEASFADARPKTCYEWFDGFTNLTAIIGIKNLNTSEVTDMSSMFYNCKNLTSIDVSTFDTKNVTNMAGMFSNCSNLTTLNLSNFNTKNVKRMYGMFANCHKLKSLDLSNFDTQNVKNMGCMFTECYELTDLNIKSFNTGKVTDMVFMFFNCKKLTTLDLSNFNTQNVENMNSMFSDCEVLKTIYATDLFVTTAVTDGSYMFKNCLALQGAIPYDAGKIGHEYANYTTGYFTKGISTIAPYAVFNATDGTLTFKQASAKPVGGYELNVGNAVPGWITDHRTDIKKAVFDGSFADVLPTSCYQWFAGCTNLEAIEDIKYLKTQAVTTTASMFEGCSGLTAIDFSDFDTQNVTNMNSMLKGCSGMANLDITTFNTAKVEDMGNMMNGCSDIVKLNLSHFDTQKVKNMSGMFRNCAALTTIFASDKFVTAQVTADADMFLGCIALKGAIVYNPGKTGKDYANYTTGYFTDPTVPAKEAYAVFKPSDGTLTFKHDATKPAGAYALNEGNTYPEWITAHKNDINTVVFDPSFASAQPTTCSLWFVECRNLTTITGIEHLNTEEVKNMSRMFMDCEKLEAIDLSKFNTANVTVMSNMFSGCVKLTALDVSKFNTAKVTDMNDMFYWCSQLTALDVSKFDTKNVTDMSGMFNHCKNLTSLNLESFDTQQVTDMSKMFYKCENLATIYASDKFVVTAVNKDENMFGLCYVLKGAIAYDATKTGKDYANKTTGYFTDPSTPVPDSYAVFNTADGTLTFKCDFAKPTGAYPLNINENTPAWSGISTNIKKVVFDASFTNARPTTCYAWFKNCEQLENIVGIENLNTSEVTNMGYMFDNCSKLISVDVSKFDTKNVTNMADMFYNCLALTSLDFSKFDTQNVTNMNAMFNSCKALTSLDLSTFNTAKVTDMGAMFAYCFALITIYTTDKFVTTAVTNSTHMFLNCNQLRGVIEYDESKIDKEYANYTTGYFTNATPTTPEAYVVFNATAGTLTFKYDMSKKPVGVYPLNKDNVTPGWNNNHKDAIKKVVFDATFASVRPTTGHKWFAACKNLATIEGWQYLNTEDMTNMNSMFAGCNAMTTLDLTKFNTAKVTDMSYMFKDCDALTTILASDKFVATAVTADTEMFDGCTKLSGMVDYDAAKTGKEMANCKTGYFIDPTVSIAYVVFDATTGTLTFKYDTAKPVGAYRLNDGVTPPTWLAQSDNIKTVVFDAPFAAVRPTTCYAWFKDCRNLTAINGIENLNTSEVTNMQEMFSNCYMLTILDLTSFDTQNVTDMSYMFGGCAELTTILASDKFVTTAVTNDTNMFQGCNKLKGAVAFDATKTGKEMANFAGYFTNPTGTGINNVDVWDNEKVEYYDLCGRRLNGPQKGVNIMKIGNKTIRSKIYIL